MKTLEEQHHDYQRHIAVLKESLVAKEEHQNMLQADVSVSYCSFLFGPRIDLESLAFQRDRLRNLVVGPSNMQVFDKQRKDYLKRSSRVKNLNIKISLIF